MARIRVPRSGPGRPRTRPLAVLADRAYFSRVIRSHLRRRGIRAVIPQPCDQIGHRLRRGRRGGRPPGFGAEIYKQRNSVERCINRRKQWRDLATRCDKLAVFGHNWDAMVDCLGDWHVPGRGKAYVAVLIDGADPLLGAEFLGDLAWTLCAGVWRANFMVDGDGEPPSPRPPSPTRTWPLPWWAGGWYSP